MKTLRWTAVIILVIVVVLAIANIRRDSIARGIANSILSEQHLVVSDLTVRSLSTDRLELAELVVESESGARYEIYGLSLPLGSASRRITGVSADRLVVTYAPARDRQELLSTAMRTVLDLPLGKPGIEANIAQVSLPGLPELGDVAWSTSEAGQSLAFSVAEISIVANVERQDDDGHAATIRAVDAENIEVLAADLALALELGKYSATGETMVRTGAWLPILSPLEVLPKGLEDLNAELSGPLTLQFDKDEPGRVVLNTTLALGAELAARYGTAGGAASDIQVTSLDGLKVAYNYPAMTWTAQAGALTATLTTDDLDHLPLQLSNVDCQSGIRCTLDAHVDALDVRWNGYDFASVELTLPTQIDVADATRITIAAEATGSFSGVQSSAFAAETVWISSFSGAEIMVGENSWQTAVDSLLLAVDAFSGAGGIGADFAITLSSLDIRDSAENVDTTLSVAAISNASWNGIAISLPGLKGTASLRGDRLGASLQLGRKDDGVSAGIEAVLDFATGKGSLAVTDAVVAFEKTPLSRLVPGLSYPLDIVHGILDTDIDLQWQTVDDVARYSGTVSSELTSIGGKYNDIAFVGLHTGVDATLKPDGGVGVAPSSLAIRLVDVGLPLENIAVAYTPTVADKAVAVDSLSLDILGGTIVADSFRLVAGEQNIIPLRAKSIQLQLMVDIAEFEDIEMVGAVSGELPVTIGEDSITIGDGRLTSDPPGGAIHYRSDDGTIDAVVPDGRMGFVTRMLNNFEFDSLTSDVDYTENGDLKLQMRMSGINPDYDPTQPIILNLGVENNVPQMLRSLQAIRSIEDILERQTEN